MCCNLFYHFGTKLILYDYMHIFKSICIQLIQMPFYFIVKVYFLSYIYGLWNNLHNLFTAHWDNKQLEQYFCALYKYFNLMLLEVDSGSTTFYFYKNLLAKGMLIFTLPAACGCSLSSHSLSTGTIFNFIFKKSLPIW